MNNFRTQLEAIGSALLLIERLDDDAVWALEVTNQDTAEEPTVLNIFAEIRQWSRIIERLHLGSGVDAGDKFISFRKGTLYISIIEEEKR